MLLAPIDIVGQTFGKLTVVSLSEKRVGKKYIWNCRCECGGSAWVRGDALKSGHTKSCGCIGVEMLVAANTVHGETKFGGIMTPEYRAHRQALDRCYNPNNKHFKDYGGRGITMADEWRGDGGFARFLEHIGRRPSSLHSIDRIDNDKGYEHGNVRWATRTEQQRNQRTRRDNKSGIRGVTFVEKLWRAYIKVDGKVIHLKKTSNFFEACCARKSAENEYWRAA